MKFYFTAFLLIILSLQAFSQPPLTRKMKRDLAKWEAEEEEKAQYKQAIGEADSLFRLKMYEASIQSYKKALEIRPKDAFSIARITDLELLLKEGEPDAVVEAEKTAVEEKEETPPPAPEPPKEENPTPVKMESVEKPAPVIEKPKVEPPEKVEETPPKVVEAPAPKPASQTKPVKSQQEQVEKPKPLNPNDFEEGVTEEIIEKENQTIIKRIVKRNGEVHVFKKVTHNWGGVYYFRDNVSITERVWEEETRE